MPLHANVVPVVYFSVTWWRGIHPRVLGSGGGLDPGMIPPLALSSVTFLLLAGILIRERFYLANAADGVDRIDAALEDMTP